MIARHELVVRQLLHPRELLELHALAAEAFGADAMPLPLVQALHWQGREGVFLLRDAAGCAQGYVAAFALTASLWDALLAGSTDPLEWQAEQIQPKPWASGVDGLYLESAVLRPAVRRSGLLLLLLSLLRWIHTGLMRSQGNSIELASLAASQAGARLLVRSLGLTLRMPSMRRRDQMDLYFGRSTPSDLATRIRRIEALVSG